MMPRRAIETNGSAAPIAQQLQEQQPADIAMMFNQQNMQHQQHQQPNPGQFVGENVRNSMAAPGFTNFQDGTAFSLNDSQTGTSLIDQQLQQQQMPAGFHRQQEMGSTGSRFQINMGAMLANADMGEHSDGRVAQFGAQQNGQNERDQELLLNILMSQRQRVSKSEGNSEAGNSQDLADELVRLRQSHGNGGIPNHPAPFAGLQPPQLHNFSPFMGGDSSGTMFPGHPQAQPHPVAANTGPMFLDYRGKPMDQQNSLNHIQNCTPGMTEMSGRIERAPTRMIDARSQEALETPGRGNALWSTGGKRQGINDFFKYGMMADANQHFYSGIPPQQFLGVQGALVQPPQLVPTTKKRRIHKKKPADMPRRPLSAYNLFFSEERERILKEIDTDKSAEENKTSDDKVDTQTAEDGEEKSSTEKPKALLRPLIPAKNKRRPHRKTHGKISFQELARMVGERWKSLPEDKRKYYQDLAQEDTKRQKLAMEEYYAKQSSEKIVHASESTPGTKETSEAGQVNGSEGKEIVV